MMRKLKKMIPVFVAGVMLCMPICANAATKGLTLVMKEKNKTISCVCPAAIIQGGAMIGGDGIDYKITFTTNGITYPVASGHCASNTTFNKIEYTSISGWSGTLKFKESQHNLDNPGIGWGRIDY